MGKRNKQKTRYPVRIYILVGVLVIALLAYTIKMFNCLVPADCSTQSTSVGVPIPTLSSDELTKTAARDNVLLPATIGSSTFVLEKVDTNQKRSKGLGGRDGLAANEGMLFVFDKPDIYPFWMEDMKFSIDIIWLDADKKVVTIKDSVSPSTYPESLSSQGEALYVIELAAGRAQELGLAVGQTVKF